MPQPLSTFSSVKLSATLSNPSHHIYQNNVQLAALAFESLVSWTKIEAHQFELFIQIMGGPDETASAVYLSLEGLSAKTSAIEAAAKIKLNDDEYFVYSELKMKVRSCAKKRDRLAHWSWGYTSDLPDAFLLAQPRQFVMDNLDKSKVFVYREQDFIDIINENNDLVKQIRHFTGVLRSGESRTNGKAFRLLIEELGL